MNVPFLWSFIVCLWVSRVLVLGSPTLPPELTAKTSPSPHNQTIRAERFFKAKRCFGNLSRFHNPFFVEERLCPWSRWHRCQERLLFRRSGVDMWWDSKRISCHGVRPEPNVKLLWSVAMFGKNSRFFYWHTFCCSLAGLPLHKKTEALIIAEEFWNHV